MAKFKPSRILTVFPPQTVISVVELILLAALHVILWLAVLGVVNQGDWLWVIVITSIVFLVLNTMFFIYHVVRINSRYANGSPSRNKYNYAFTLFASCTLFFLMYSIFGLVFAVGSTPADFDVSNVANFVLVNIYYGVGIPATFFLIAFALFNFPAHGNYQYAALLEYNMAASMAESIEISAEPRLQDTRIGVFDGDF